MNRILHWLAGLFCGYLFWVCPVAGIALAILFTFDQIVNEYAESNPMDFSKDIWDFMLASFIGAGIGLILRWM